MLMKDTTSLIINKKEKLKTMAHEERHHHCMHVAFDIAKLALKVASVAAAFCIVKEVHRVHKAIEHRHEK